MRRSLIKAKLASDDPVLVVHLQAADPAVYEMVSLMGVDGIWVDLEHSPKSLETAAHLMRAARVGVADIVARPARGEFMRAGRLLEAGAQGIMYPRCSGASEAAEVVKYVKFAPLGIRGVDGGNADVPYGTMDLAPYTQMANDETFVVVQLEEQEAIDRAHEIAAVDGVDILFLGPADYSVLSGFPDQWDHPRIGSAQRAIAEAARTYGKHWGAPVDGPEGAKELLDLGARFICCGVDLVWLREGLQRTQKAFAPLGFTFDSQVDQETSLP